MLSIATTSLGPVSTAGDMTGDVTGDIAGDMAEQFVRDGYLVVPGLVSADEVAAFNAEIPRFARGEYPMMNPEELQPGVDDDDALRSLLCVHFPHWVNPRFAEAIRHPGVASVLGRIVGAHLPGWDGRVKAMQSLLFVKPPGLPGQAWHQDEHFIPTRDRSLCGAWIALDDATIDNGCLWVVPGSHRMGMLYPVRPHGRPDLYDGAPQAYDPNDPADDAGSPASPFDERGVPVPVKAGDVVFFNGYLLHRSLPNRTTDVYRRALVNHYCNAWSLLPWTVSGVSSGNDYRAVVPVVGEDPYAWKGYDPTPGTVYIRPHAQPVTHAASAPTTMRQAP